MIDAHDLAEADGRDREKNAAQLAHRVGEQRGDQRRARDREYNARCERPMVLHARDRRRVGRDAGQAGLCERQLAGLQRHGQR